MIKRLKCYYKKRVSSAEDFAKYLGVKIGRNCDIQDVNFGSEPYLIEIGNHVQVTNGVKFFTHGAAWVLRDKNPDVDFFGKIKIEDNVYIGNNSIILAGVTIESNVIVAAGSVVTKSVVNGQIVGGNPAKIIGYVAEFAVKIKEFDVKSKGLNFEDKKKHLLSLDDSKFIRK